MTAYNEMAKFLPPSTVLSRYIDAQVCRRDSVVVALRSFLNYNFMVLARIVAEMADFHSLSLSLSYILPIFII